MDARTPIPAPTMWPGIALEIDTIVMGKRVVAAQVRDLQAAYQARELGTLKRAADELAEIATNMKVMSDHLSKVISGHQKRRARL